MGSRIRDGDELTVLVTGFGASPSPSRPVVSVGGISVPWLTHHRQPFRDQYPVNPSWEIARGLPPHLPALRAKDANARHAVETPPVRVLVHPEPVRVSYKAVRELVPSFWDTERDQRVDIAIHIGMAGPRPLYQIECRGHRTGYKSPDVDGERLEDEEEGGHGEDWIWYGLPDELETDLSLQDVLERWQRHSSKDMDLRISEDAGNYLCDFIYYSSLSTLFKQQRPKQVVFLHVPCDASERFVAQGRELAVNLIRAIVESETAKKQTQTPTPDDKSAAQA